MTSDSAETLDALPEARDQALSPTGALACLSLSMLMPSLDTSIANVGLPTLARAFGASFHAVQWIVLAYLLAITTSVVSAGRLGDLLGRQRVLQLGIGLFTGASLLCGLAPSFGILIAARALQGLGAALMMALAVALVGEAIPKARTGQAMGWLGTMSALGTLLGPSLGGLLIAGFGWRVIFLVNVPLGLLNAWLVHRYLPRPSGRSGHDGGRFDGLGTLLLALALGAYALAVTAKDRAFGRLNLVLLGVAVLSVGLFLRVERRAASPLLRLEAFRRPLLSRSLGLNVLVAAVMMTTLVVGPFYLSRALGLREAWVGLVMAAGPLGSILSGVPAGRAVDRWGASRMARLALLQMTAGALALALLPPRFGVPGYLAALLVLTPGYQLFQAANGTAVMLGIGAEDRGVVSGLLSLSRNLGLITGAAVMGALFAFAAGAANLHTASAAAVTAGLRGTFLTAAAALAVGWALRVPGREA